MWLDPTKLSTGRRENLGTRLSGVLFHSRYVRRIMRCVKLWLHLMLSNANSIAPIHSDSPCEILGESKLDPVTVSSLLKWQKYCYPSVLCDKVRVLLVNGLVHVQLATINFELLSLFGILLTTVFVPFIRNSFLKISRLQIDVFRTPKLKLTLSLSQATNNLFLLKIPTY